MNKQKRNQKSIELCNDCKKYNSWTADKAKLSDWNHYSIKIKTLKDDFENFNLREFEIEITKQNHDLSTTKFKKVKIETCFIDLLQDLIPKLKMYSCYIQFNDSEYYDLNVFNFFCDICKWRNHVENIYQKHDSKEIKYRKNLKSQEDGVLM